MLVAELELFLSRPVAPTRRVAIGDSVLPKGPGGVLLGAVAATFSNDINPEWIPELARLTRHLERGLRVPQPRLRHRLQEDRVGLTSHRHRLKMHGEAVVLDLDDRGNPMPHILGAIYAAGRLDDDHREVALAAIRRGLAWSGSVGPALLNHLGATRPQVDWSLLVGAEPKAWALDVLGLVEGTDAPLEAAAVQRRFRELLRAAHPDHGGQTEMAADRINELSRARKILLAG